MEGGRSDAAALKGDRAEGRCGGGCGGATEGGRLWACGACGVDRGVDEERAEGATESAETRALDAAMCGGRERRYEPLDLAIGRCTIGVSVRVGVYRHHYGIYFKVVEIGRRD